MIFIAALTFVPNQDEMVNILVKFYTTMDAPARFRHTEFTIPATLLYSENYQLFLAAIDFAKAAMQKEAAHDR